MRVLFGKEATETAFKGIEELYEAVRTTLGPGGRNVFIYSPGNPIITHDGVTVAGSVAHSGKPEKLAGVELIRNAAEKMGDKVGDGTTSVTVLAYHIMLQARKLIDEGVNPMTIWKQLQLAEKKLQEALKPRIEKVSDKRLEDVATVSAADHDLGELIAGLLGEIGADSYVSIEESQTTKTTAEALEGYSLDYGLISPYLVTDNVHMRAELPDPAVLVIKGTLNSIDEVQNLIEVLLKNGKKEIVIAATEMSDLAMKNLVLNKVQKVLDVAAVAIDDDDDLEDLAAVTGAVLVDRSKGMQFEQVDPTVIGNAKKVVVSTDQLTVIGGIGKVDDHIKALGAKPENANRIARINQQVGIIRVGGSSKTEIAEKAYRVEDAVAATKAAMRSGVLPGGGITLYSLAKELGDDHGASVLKEALKQPYTQILANAGHEFKEPSLTHGVEAISGEFVDLAKAGILDPAEVTQQVLETAVSVAGLAMTMGALIMEEQE